VQAHLGGVGHRRHLYSRQQDWQLRQLQLWQAHVWRCDRGERVLGDGGVVEGEEEARAWLWLKVWLEVKI
jgi:hypothetical protein